MLAMITALSLSACGTTTESTGTSSEGNSDVQITTKPADTEQAAPADSTTSAVTEATEQTTTATTAPEEPETPVELPVITLEPKSFDNVGCICNGNIAFKCDGKNYVYNITENEMYETEHDISTISVLKGCIAVFGDVPYYDGLSTDNYVVNLKTGEIYDNVRSFYNYNDNSSYLTVGTLEEGFSVNTATQIGMLNSKGEWVLPLSGDYAVCKIDDIDKTSEVANNKDIISFRINNTQYNYDIANDKLIEDIDVLTITDDKIFVNEDWNAYEYDMQTGDKKHIDIAVNRTDHPSFRMSKDKTKVYDENYNLFECDLSEYNIIKDIIRGGNEDVVVFNAINDKGERYTIVLNKDGSYVCEPYEHTDIKEQAYHANVSENKVILFGYKDRIIDRNTGEITTFDSNFEIIAYDDVNDLMLVKTNGAYYLVDPEAPDVLINPFERASN